MGGKAVRCLSRVSLEGEIAEVGGSLLLLHCDNPSQEKAKQQTLGITGEVHRRLFIKIRNFKEEPGQSISLLSVAFALSNITEHIFL